MSVTTSQLLSGRDYESSCRNDKLSNLATRPGSFAVGNRILLTAFEPYDEWQTNASWLALVELTKDLPLEPEVTTRLYPVDYDLLSEKLDEDLRVGFDVALHLGQSPLSSTLHLESIAVNVATGNDGSHRSLCPDGPVAYQSELPLNNYVTALSRAGIPAQVSFHAGTHLCNAALYLSHHVVTRMQLPTKSAFIHIPLDTSQVVANNMPFMPTSMVVRALHIVLDSIAKSEAAPTRGIA